MCEKLKKKYDQNSSKIVNCPVEIKLQLYGCTELHWRIRKNQNGEENKLYSKDEVDVNVCHFHMIPS
jgi:hypothetical protein